MIVPLYCSLSLSGRIMRDAMIGLLSGSIHAAIKVNSHTPFGQKPLPHP